MVEDLYDATEFINDDEPGLPAREAELHQLVTLHERLSRIQSLIEDEFAYRTEYHDQLAAATDEQREYAVEHAQKDE